MTKLVDAKEACCLDTLSKPIEEAMALIEAGGALEVLVRPSFEKMLQRFAEGKGYTIVERRRGEEEICFRIEKTAVEREKEKPLSSGMRKSPPITNYPAEKGCFLRGNDYSPVAVAVLLNAPYGTLPPEVKSIPPAIEKLVRVAVETGAALSGTLQTENIGIEKVVCNIVGNPNIRYLVLCGTEVAGHESGSALRALLINGINEKRTIMGSQAATPYLFNISLEAIERFRRQVTLVDLVGETDSEVIGKAVWSCYQESPTQFKGYSLYDPGSYAESGICATLTGKVEHPEEIEEWELDDIVRQIEAPAAGPGVEAGPLQQERRGKESLIGVGEAKIRSFLSKRLLRISEELEDIAELLGEEIEAPLVSPPTVRGRAEWAQPSTVVKGKPVEKPLEETPTLAYFKSQLRGFHNILAGLEACDRDICHGGRSLPLAVGSTVKRLERLKECLEEATLPGKDKTELMTRLQVYLQRAEALPQQPGPCQKTVGTCTIGVGCFAAASADLIKLVKTPEPPEATPGG